MKHVNRNDLIESYLAGKSFAKLSRQYGISTKAIRSILIAADIKIRGRSEAGKIRTSRRTILSQSLVEELTREYIAGKSTSKMARDNRISRTVIYTHLKAAGVCFRSNRQALATAAGSIEARTKKSIAAKARFARMSAQERDAYFLKAAKSKLGRKHTTEQKERIAAGRQRTLAHTSPNEYPLIDTLRNLGHDITPQMAVGPYNLDIALEKLRVAVEVENGNFLTQDKNRPGYVRKRLEYLLNRGWSILFVITRQSGIILPDISQKLLTFFDLAGRNKTFSGQYGMIRSDGKSYPRSANKFDRLPRVPGF